MYLIITTILVGLVIIYSYKRYKLYKVHKEFDLMRRFQKLREVAKRWVGTN
jgi:hypothetical protein